MVARARARIVLIGASALVLAGCAPTPAPIPQELPPSPSPSETAPAVTVLDEDVLLVVTARATSADGSPVDLSMQVHRALAWDDPEAAPLAALMTAGCEGSLEASVYEENLWSFSSVNVSAIFAKDNSDWTGNDTITLLPHPTDELALASEGTLNEDGTVDQATPHCLRSRQLGLGEGLLVLGIPGDTDAAGAAGQFTRWANSAYGFSVSDGVTLSDCKFLVTDAGKELNGGAEWWSQLVTSSECVIGTDSP